MIVPHGRFHDRSGSVSYRAPSRYFTTPHFNGYPAVLVRLDAIDLDELEELLTEAWLAQAPKRLAASYLADHT